MPSHGDKDSVLPGAERLRDGGPASLPELPVAWALCQPCEVKAPRVPCSALPFCPLAWYDPSTVLGLAGLMLEEETGAQILGIGSEVYMPPGLLGEGSEQVVTGGANEKSK